MNHKVLNVHCKSKDDDLGNHVLKGNANFHVTFCVNVWATTLFWCNFNWENSHGGKYNVWWATTLIKDYCNYDNCIWVARVEMMV